MMSNLSFDPLLLSIATPLALALLIALGLPKRWSVRLSYVAFAVPLLMALHAWWQFSTRAADRWLRVSDSRIPPGSMPSASR